MDWIRISLVVVVFVGCGSLIPGGSCDTTSTFGSLLAEFWNWRLETIPSLATYTGSYKYNDRYGSLDWREIAGLKERCDLFLGNLTQISRDDLSTADRLTYDIFHDQLTTYTGAYRWWKHCALNQFNFLAGKQRDISWIPGGMPKDTIGDLTNYLARLNKYPLRLDQMIERTRKAMEEPKFMLHNASVDRIPGQIEKLFVLDPKDSPLYDPFNTTLEKLGIKEAQKLNIRAIAATATQAVLDKYAEVKEFLETEYMPNSRSGYGLSTLGEDGKKLYKDILKWHTATDMTAEEIYQKGLDEVDRISGEMYKLIEKLGHNGTIKSFYDTVKTDERFLRNTSDELVAIYTDLIKRATEKLPDLFENYPGNPVRIEEMLNEGPPAAYSPGSEDGSRPGVFYVNNLRPRDVYLFDMPGITLHEAVPGHHLQLGNYQLKADLANFRKYPWFSMGEVPLAFPRYTAYTEGWGLYAEYLGEEMGMYRDDYELMGRYGLEIFRACRLVVDSGLHHYSWDRQRAIDYMLNYTAFPEATIINEVDRYITWPGQATAYKIGELKIKELRRKSQAELGDRFDVRGFHGVILNNGPVPLSILEKLVDEWIQTVKTRKPTSAANPAVYCSLFSVLLTLSISIMLIL